MCDTDFHTDVLVFSHRHSIYRRNKYSRAKLYTENWKLKRFLLPHGILGLLHQEVLKIFTITEHHSLRTTPKSSKYGLKREYMVSNKGRLSTWVPLWFTLSPSPPLPPPPSNITNVKKNKKTLMVAFSSLGECQRIWSFPPTFLFFKWRSVCTHKFHFLGQDQFTVAQQAEMPVDKCSLMSCMWAQFPDSFPHYAWTAQSAHSDFVGSRVSLGQG